MKGLKVSELKAFLHILTETDDDVVTKKDITRIFDGFGDQYHAVVSYENFFNTDEGKEVLVFDHGNPFKDNILSHLHSKKAGESK